jgi:hypothetical protein
VCRNSVAECLFLALAWVAFPTCGVTWKCWPVARTIVTRISPSTSETRLYGTNGDMVEDIDASYLSINGGFWYSFIITCLHLPSSRTPSSDQQTSSSTCLGCAFQSSLASAITPPLAPPHFTLSLLDSQPSCLSIVRP